MEAPSTMLPDPADDFEVPLGCRNLGKCNIQICKVVRGILHFHTATEEQLLAVCNCLPMRELRAFSLLARSFRAASTLAWSEDVMENEHILLSIAQKDQPGFLAKAVTDSGISKASLGRVLLQATNGGEENRSHRCCRLLGELGAVIRLEDAVMVTGGEDFQRGICIRRKIDGPDGYDVYDGNDLYLRRDPASHLDGWRQHGFEGGPPRATLQEWQGPYWVLRDDGGFNFAHVALSTSALPPADGWHWIIEHSPNIQTRQLQLGDLLDQGPIVAGQLVLSFMERREVESYLPVV